MNIAHKISHGMNVVVVNNQSANSKKNLLLFDWMLTMATFVLWDILWTMAMRGMAKSALGVIDTLSMVHNGHPWKF